jgi:phosphopantetheinyl transferase (holo-ACP synthase)
VTISSTWTFDPGARLVGCGIDAERIERFCQWTKPDAERPAYIYNQDEFNWCRSRPDPALALCASFCCKEALFKAIGAPYNYTGCSARYDWSQDKCVIDIAEEILAEHGFSRAVARIFVDCDHCIAAVHPLSDHSLQIRG